MKLIAVIFSLVGTAIMAASFFSAKTTIEHLQNSVLTQSVVVDIEWRRSSSSKNNSSSAYPTFEYIFQGQKYKTQSNFGSSPSQFDKGQNVEIYVDPADPKSIKANTFVSLWLLPICFGVFGLIFGGIGYALIYSAIKKKMKLKRLRREGQKFWGEISDIKRSNITINKKPTYYITLKATCFGQNHSFESDLVIDLKGVKLGDQMPVLVSRLDTKDYAIETEEVRKITYSKVA